MRTIHVDGTRMVDWPSFDAADVFKASCPEQYLALVECAAFLNWRRIEVGEPPILVLSFNV